MLPVVEVAEPVPGEAPVDRRKTRQVGWKEARLALADESGSVTPILGAILGKRGKSGRAAGGLHPGSGSGKPTQCHGVGDGAVWITEQMEAQFGAQAQYLVDFCHLCDYLSAAGEVITQDDKAARLQEKKDWLKDNRWRMFWKLSDRS